jgi:hypothetical protein
MNILIQPEYTTERYSVLADLEQRAEFIAVNELDTESIGGTTNDPTDGPAKQDFRFIYILWDLRELCIDQESYLVQSLLNKVELVLKSLKLNTKDCERIMLSVEVITSHIFEGSVWPRPSVIDTVVSDAFTAVQTRFRFGYILFGIADDVGSSTALTAVLRCVEKIGSDISPLRGRLQYGDSVKIGNIFIMDRSELLGFAKNRDPDAVSGVFQAWVRSMDDGGLNRWTAELANTTNRVFDVSRERRPASLGRSLWALVPVVAFAIIYRVYLNK